MTRKPEAERFSQLVFYATVLLIGYLAWRMVQPFLGEIAWAVVLAICLEPLRDRLAPRLGRNRAAAARLREMKVTAPMVCTADNALTFQPRPADTGWAVREWPQAGQGVVGIAAVNFHLQGEARRGVALFRQRDPHVARADGGLHRLPGRQRLEADVAKLPFLNNDDSTFASEPVSLARPSVSAPAMVAMCNNSSGVK